MSVSLLVNGDMLCTVSLFVVRRQSMSVSLLMNGDSLCRVSLLVNRDMYVECLFW